MATREHYAGVQYYYKYRGEEYNNVKELAKAVGVSVHRAEQLIRRGYCPAMHMIRTLSRIKEEKSTGRTEAQKASSKKYYEKNKEKIRAYYKEYRRKKKAEKC
jgi:hypothetical protein